MRTTVLLLVLMATAQTTRADDTAAAIRDWVEATVPAMMREARMPGFAIAVVRDGETIYAEGFGARDPANNLPATPDTLFGIGSITKSFVAISILQLAEKGLLDLDDPVSEHLSFRLGRPGEPIRIRHLLTHSPGFPNLATSTVLISRGLGEDTGVPMSSADDFFRFVNGATDEIEFAPGEHFFYNNAAWRMLGAIVQERSGMPFHQYVTENVIRPLGMQRSTFDTDAFHADADRITPHRLVDGKAEPAPFPYPNPAGNRDFSFLSAAGGITSSVAEMTHYMNMLIEKGRYPAGRLIGERSMRDMQRLHISEPDGDYGRTGYGFGLGITPDFLGETLVDHGGSISVSTSHMSLVPSRGLGVVVMGNSSGMTYPLITEGVLALMLGKDPDTAIPGLVIRERMNRLVGHYSTYRDLQKLEVVMDGGLLYLERGGNRVPLIPDDLSYATLDFQTHGYGRRSPVHFNTENGEVVSLRVGRYVYRKRN